MHIGVDVLERLLFDDFYRLIAGYPGPFYIYIEQKKIEP